MAPIHVAAAILKMDGRILICKRPEEKRYGGLWEFPGGKVEKGETPAQALVREMQEELNLFVEVDTVYHEATDGEITVTFLCCRQTGGLLTLNEHQAYAFEAPENFIQYDFSPADKQVVTMLMKRPRFAHYIWDFDGMLMDTYPEMTRAMHLALKDLGIRTDEAELMQHMKRSVREAISHYGADEQRARERYAFYEHQSVWTAKPIEGVAKALATIKALGGHNHIYTHRGDMTHALVNKAFPEGMFTGIITAADKYKMKPAPDALNALCAAYYINKADALMVGDRDIDVICAQNAGIAGCLYDAEGFYKDFQTPYRITDMADFIQWFI